MRVDRAIESNFIVYEWDDEILKYSQRNLEVGKGQYIIYDLHRIESKLANTLVYSKVHFEGGNEQLVLDPFPYHLELFSSSIRILGEIKSLIPQEEIPSEKLSLIIGQQSVPSYLTLSASLSTLTSKDNSSELLSLLEILLCFIKRTSIGDGNLLLNEFINQWVQLSSLTENSRFKTILSYELQLKHVVSLYEVIEEQVANIMIQFIDKKFKEPLTDDMKKDLDDAIDFEGGNKGKIPADSFIIAMKRFIQRVLQAESDKETHPLNTYVTDMSLSLWPSNNVIEEVLDDKFPDTLFVANSFAAYEYVLQKKETSKPKQSYSGGMSNKPPSFNTSSISETTASSPSQSTQPSAFTLKNKGKKVIRDE
ncbi:921_t:CDS:2 [Rhizophagus irregularis]|nr:921_t:CDS:2 [Rhizophagus irregularis]